MKLNNRILGTIAGMGVTFVLTEIFKSLTAFLILMKKQWEKIGSYMRRRQITPKNNMMLGEDRVYGCLDEELYFNTLAMNCMETVNELNKIFRYK